jgi:hypothetical protein
LRRTARTGLAAEGIIAEIAERVVGHVQTGIIGVYDHHRYDQEKRAALEAWERRLLRIVRHIRYQKQDLDAWLARHRVQPVREVQS